MVALSPCAGRFATEVTKGVPLEEPFGVGDFGIPVKKLRLAVFELVLEASRPLGGSHLPLAKRLIALSVPQNKCG